VPTEDAKRAFVDAIKKWMVYKHSMPSKHHHWISVEDGQERLQRHGVSSIPTVKRFLKDSSAGEASATPDSRALHAPPPLSSMKRNLSLASLQKFLHWDGEALQPKHEEDVSHALPPRSSIKRSSSLEYLKTCFHWDGEASRPKHGQICSLKAPLQVEFVYVGPE